MTKFQAYLFRILVKLHSTFEKYCTSNAINNKKNEFDWKFREKMNKNKCVFHPRLKGVYKLHGHATDVAIKEFQYIE